MITTIFIHCPSYSSHQPLFYCTLCYAPFRKVPFSPSLYSSSCSTLLFSHSALACLHLFVCFDVGLTPISIHCPANTPHQPVFYYFIKKEPFSLSLYSSSCSTLLFSHSALACLHLFVCFDVGLTPISIHCPANTPHQPVFYYFIKKEPFSLSLYSSSCSTLLFSHSALACLHLFVCFDVGLTPISIHCPANPPHQPVFYYFINKVPFSLSLYSSSCFTPSFTHSAPASQHLIVYFDVGLIPIFIHCLPSPTSVLLFY